MKGYRRISIICNFLVAALLIGCGSNTKNEDIITEEVIIENVTVDKSVEEMQQEASTVSNETSETQQEEEELIEVSKMVGEAGETGEKIVWGDVDGNGEEEYFIILNEEEGILSLYFNNELIYQYVDQYLQIDGIEKHEYIDLDNDGEKEIFVVFWPRVNSMPLVEWFALKQGETGWELMEMYHQNDDMSQNAFPISVVLKEKDFVLSINCEGIDKNIVYDATKHYEKKKEDKEEWNDNTYDIYVGSNFEIGDVVGSTSAWGIWNIESGVYDDQNCLIAEHGLDGVTGKYDFYGYLDVYFCFDANAKIKILDIVFTENVES